MADVRPPAVAVRSSGRPVTAAASYTDAAVYFDRLWVFDVPARTADHAGALAAWDLADFVAAAVRAYAATPEGLAHWAAARPASHTPPPTTTTTPPPPEAE